MAEGADARREYFGGDDEGGGVGAEVEGELGARQGTLVLSWLVGSRVGCGKVGFT